jgi:hypothetical protein
VGATFDLDFFFFFGFPSPALGAAASSKEPMESEELLGFSEQRRSQEERIGHE